MFSASLMGAYLYDTNCIVRFHFTPRMDGLEAPLLLYNTIHFYCQGLTKTFQYFNAILEFYLNI